MLELTDGELDALIYTCLLRHTGKRPYPDYTNNFPDAYAKLRDEKERRAVTTKERRAVTTTESN